MAKKETGDYPKKKSVGLTKEQDATLKEAVQIRGKSETFLIREYVEAGANTDIQSHNDAQQGQ